jgi:uncharacterized membrane protein
MSGGWERCLALVAAIGAGTSAGVFFAFSTFVMSGLGSARPAEGMAAMQGVNRAAPRPPLMALLVGTAAASIVLAVADLGELGSSVAARYELAGALLFLAALVLTRAYHIPRNDALGRLDAADPASAAPAGPPGTTPAAWPARRRRWCSRWRTGRPEHRARRWPFDAVRCSPGQ